jgi:hypothetical protein
VGGISQSARLYCIEEKPRDTPEYYEGSFRSAHTLKVPHQYPATILTYTLTPARRNVNTVLLAVVQVSVPVVLTVSAPTAVSVAVNVAGPVPEPVLISEYEPPSAILLMLKAPHVALGHRLINRIHIRAEASLTRAR